AHGRADRPIAAVESVVLRTGPAAIGRAVFQVHVHHVALVQVQAAPITIALVQLMLDRLASHACHVGALQGKEKAALMRGPWSHESSACGSNLPWPCGQHSHPFGVSTRYAPHSKQCSADSSPSPAHSSCWVAWSWPREGANRSGCLWAMFSAPILWAGSRP